VQIKPQGILQFFCVIARMATFAKFWSFPLMRTFRLVIACPDRVGIVAKVSNFLASHNGWITEASQPLRSSGVSP